MVDFCCVSLVSHYLNDILCKNYNNMFVFAKVIPKTLLVPFFPDTVYMNINFASNTVKNCEPNVCKMDVLILFNIFSAKVVSRITGSSEYSSVCPSDSAMRTWL